MLATVHQVYSQLGGVKGFGRIVRSESEMETAVREGLSTSVLRQIQSGWGLTVMEISGGLSIPRSTLMHMMKEPKRMTAADSDRVYRLVSILALAEQYIGDRLRALAWLRQPNRMLGSATPLSALETEIGRQRVLQVLGQIAYGGVA